MFIGKDNENNCKSEQVAKTSSDIINNETEKKRLGSI